MNRIKDIIKEKGYTQEYFANILGISRMGLVQQLNKPSYTTLEKIASALDVPIWQLFVSPKEVVDEYGGKSGRIICPHCGKPIGIDINIELKK